DVAGPVSRGILRSRTGPQVVGALADLSRARPAVSIPGRAFYPADSRQCGCRSQCSVGLSTRRLRLGRLRFGRDSGSVHGCRISGDGAAALEKRAGGISEVAAEARFCPVLPAPGSGGSYAGYDSGGLGSAGAGGGRDGALVGDFAFAGGERFLDGLHV